MNLPLENPRVEDRQPHSDEVVDLETPVEEDNCSQDSSQDVAQHHRPVYILHLDNGKHKLQRGTSQIVTVTYVGSAIRRTEGGKDEIDTSSYTSCSGPYTNCYS